MRIVYVAWQGSEHTRRWAGFFAARGHEVHVVTCGAGEPGDASPAYAVHDLRTSRFGKLGYLLRLRRARRLIRSLEPDVVHAHHATSYGLLAAVANVHPLVVSCHGSDILLSGRNRFIRPLLRRVLNAADLITVPGPHVADRAAELGGNRQHIAVFQYGVEVDRLRSIRSAVVSDPQRREIRLVSARGLDALYHTDEVLRAMAILRARGVECVYDLAGRGSEADALRRLADELGIADRVTFHGHVPEGAAEQLIANADVFVSVPSSDGVSIALLEAMALGAIPLVSDIPANHLWIRDGVNGVIVQIAPHSIADGVLRALELDAAEIRQRNLELVEARGDRQTNLENSAALIAQLVGGDGDALPAT